MNKREELKAMLDAVDRMAAEMKKKLRKKAADGYQGGLQQQNADVVRDKLKRHVVRLTGENYLPPKPDHHQAVDVANLAMMLWVLGNTDSTRPVDIRQQGDSHG